MFYYYFTCNCNFKASKVPEPFKSFNKDQVPTTKMIVIVLWFMSLHTDYSTENIRQFMVHVHNTRRQAKDSLMTRNDTLDTQSRIDLSQLMIHLSEDDISTVSVHSEHELEVLQIQSGIEPPDGYVCYKLDLFSSLSSHIESITTDFFLKFVVLAFILYHIFYPLYGQRIRPMTPQCGLETDKDTKLGRLFKLSPRTLIVGTCAIGAPLTTLAMGGPATLAVLASAKHLGTCFLLSGAIDILNTASTSSYFSKDVFKGDRFKSQSGTEQRLSSVNTLEMVDELLAALNIHSKSSSSKSFSIQSGMESDMPADASAPEQSLSSGTTAKESDSLPLCGSVFAFKDNTTSKQVTNDANIADINVQSTTGFGGQKVFNVKYNTKPNK